MASILPKKPHNLNSAKFLAALGDDVKRLRADRSQKETADAADMTQSRLSDIEAGKVNITISKLLDIAAALKKSLEIRFR